jgi:hypothetical protein
MMTHELARDQEDCHGDYSANEVESTQLFVRIGDYRKQGIGYFPFVTK